MRSTSRTFTLPLLREVRETSSPVGRRTSTVTWGARVSAGFHVAMRPSDERRAGTSMGIVLRLTERFGWTAV